MLWRIEVKDKIGSDPVGIGILHSIKQLGIKTIRNCRFVFIYTLQGEISKDDAKEIAKELLCDPVSEEFSLLNPEENNVKTEQKVHRIEIAYNQGVMDPVEESVLRGIKTLQIKGCNRVYTSRLYVLDGELTEKQIEFISQQVLMNSLIQHRVRNIKEEYSQIPVSEKKFEIKSVDILYADDNQLIEISKNRQLFLNLPEMKAIKDHFFKLKRNPTDIEIETIAQTWSEHCVHKTFKGLIEYEEKDPTGNTIKNQSIDNLLKSTIIRATDEIKKDWCISVFKDNAGIIEFDKDDAVCFKVETHNHPSALEPYGGANTGLGGVIRDILGTGLGAKPIASTDVFCFGSPDTFQDLKLPPGTLHPKRIMKGVVSGVRDYGNKMGIPTVNGAVCFDEGFVSNPLVYCGNIGMIPKTKCFKSIKSGYRIVVAGGRTGRDGIHGATFSSGELTQESNVISSGAVQIGNPITEKKLADALLTARDKGLYTSITDCGAGGLSSAVGEMGEECGAVVYLDRVPLKYQGLSYWEIWISEAQERMVIAVAEQNLEEILKLFSEEDVEAADIGYFSDDRMLRLFWKETSVCELEMDFIHHGLPKIARKAVWIHKDEADSPYKEPIIERATKKVISSLNVCSKEWIIRQYDHEVQAGSILKPLTGTNEHSPSDCAIIRPKLNSLKGILISNGINPEYGKIDPYWMAGSVIDEAIRQAIGCGADRNRIALLDNFCWGAPDKQDRLGGLVRAAKACYDFAKAYGTPFISGKDSLNNEYIVDNISTPIPPTLLISAISIIDDITKTISSDFKIRESLVYVLGNTYNELAGSVFFKEFGIRGGFIPKVRPSDAIKTFDSLNSAIKKGLVLSCHDCSEGGILVALAEMTFAGNTGVSIDTRKIKTAEPIKKDSSILFSESNSRFIVEVDIKKSSAFEKIMRETNPCVIGKTTKLQRLRITGLQGRIIADIPIEELKNLWSNSLSKIINA